MKETKPLSFEEPEVSLYSRVVMLIAAFLFLDIGFYEVCKLVGHFAFSAPENLNLSVINFFFIPIGIGLLGRRSSSQDWAMIWLTIAILGGLAVIGFTVYQVVFSNKNFKLYETITATIVIVLVGCIWRTLAKNDTYFDSAELTQKAKQRRKVLIWTFLIVSLCHSVINILGVAHYEKIIANKFTTNLKVYAFGSDTNESVGGLSVQIAEPETHDLEARVTGSGIDDKGLYLQKNISATAPFSIEIKGDGYQPKQVAIDRQTFPIIEVFLDPQTEAP